MRMVDLFSGIGGFSLAASWVWGDDLEIACFCERDQFCQKVLKKHWPDVPIVEDVNDVERIVAYAKRERCFTSKPFTGNISSIIGKAKSENNGWKKEIDLLTGGFPCQPASCAGKRQGTEDSRWLWPQTLTVIRAVEPSWCLLENVPGLLTIESGVLFETVCSELEDAGYEVQPLIIPAAGVGAPHRRDRVWIVAKSRRWQSQQCWNPNKMPLKWNCETRTADKTCGSDFHAPDSTNSRIEGVRREWKDSVLQDSWSEHWYSVATRTCSGRVDDGISSRVDRHRTNRLKSLGNAIVPQVAAEIMRAIKQVMEGDKNNGD